MPYTIALINTALGPALRRGRAEVLHPEVATRSDRHRPVRADPKPKLPRRDHDLHGLRNHLVALDPVRRQLRVDLRVLRPQHDQEGPLDVAASRLHRQARTGLLFAPPRRAVYDHKPTSDSARDAVGWAAAACRDPTSPLRPMHPHLVALPSAPAPASKRGNSSNDLTNQQVTSKSRDTPIHKS